MRELTGKARAKINLTLDVTGLRPDGYHDMRMVMQSVTLEDTLILKPGQGLGIQALANFSFLPQDENNLAVKAAVKFRQAAGQSWENLTIEIQKRIPVCAGTAGGSSDAAAVLRGLNELTDAGFSLEKLAQIGAAVGSDVPYCVLGGTALAEGRGEILTPLTPMPSCWIVLCKPGFAISTPELFQRLDQRKVRRRPDTEGMLQALREENLGGVARRMFNVFEDILPRRQKREIDTIKNRLIQGGALGACMSGTGPTVFGVFDRQDWAEEAVTRLKENHSDVFLTEPV